MEYDKVHYAGYSLKEVEVILDPNVVPAASLTQTQSLQRRSWICLFRRNKRTPGSVPTDLLLCFEPACTFRNEEQNNLLYFDNYS